MTRKTNSKAEPCLQAMLSENEDLLRQLMQSAVQEFLEAEMNEALGATKSERSVARLGYRSGSYPRKLITRVGTLELRVPQDRQGRFSTEIFERYQRSEKAIGNWKAKGLKAPKEQAQWVQINDKYMMVMITNGTIMDITPVER